MASMSVGPSTPVVVPSGLPDSNQPLEKKKATRKNPARRKSEQAKLSRAQSSETVSTVDEPLQRTPDGVTIPPLPDNDQIASSKQRKTPRKLRMQPSRAVTSDTTVPARPPMPKQNSAPVTNTIANVRPQLARSLSTLNERRSNLALVAPALVTGGLVGCVAGAAILSGVCMWHDASGVNSAILAAQAARICVDNLTDDIVTSLRAGTFSTDEALDVLRRSTLAYASTIPRGTAFVERVFREIEMVRKQRGREVDSVLVETCQQLSTARSRGATHDEMQDIAWKQLAKLSAFASNTLKDVVDRNPTLKPYNEQRPKVPTLRVNMTVRKKQPTAG